MHNPPFLICLVQHSPFDKFAALSAASEFSTTFLSRPSKFQFCIFGTALSKNAFPCDDIPREIGLARLVKILTLYTIGSSLSRVQYKYYPHQKYYPAAVMRPVLKN